MSLVASFARCWTKHPNYEVLEVQDDSSPLPATAEAEEQRNGAGQLEARLHLLGARVSHLQAENAVLQHQVANLRALASRGSGSGSGQLQLAEVMRERDMAVLERDAAIAALAAEKQRVLLLEERLAERGQRSPRGGSESVLRPQGSCGGAEGLSTRLDPNVFPLRQSEQSPTALKPSTPARPLFSRQDPRAARRDMPAPRSTARDSSLSSAICHRNLAAAAASSGSDGSECSSPPKDMDSSGAADDPWTVDWSNIQRLVERSRRLRHAVAERSEMCETE